MMDYSKQTVDQIKKTLKERGVVFRSKARKGDLVNMLVEEDAKKKQDAAGGGSEAANVNLNESGGSLVQASDAPPKNKEVWIIETESRSEDAQFPPETNIVGVFTSKDEAIKNAKTAFANMDLFEEFVGDWENEDLEDHSEKFNQGCEGGVLFAMGLQGMGIELQGRGDVGLDSVRVNMYKSCIDKVIKPGREREPWLMDDKWSHFKPTKPNYRDTATLIKELRAKFPNTMDDDDADCNEEESDSD